LKRLIIEHFNRCCCRVVWYRCRRGWPLRLKAGFEGDGEGRKESLEAA